MVLLGGAIGALMGVFNKSGVDAQFRNRVEHLLEPGHSAVVIMASKITEDKFATAMQPFGGTILKSLRLDECTLPEQGWGVLEFSEISSAAGRDWTDDGQVHEASTPKGGPPNAIRRVPIPPALVTSEG